MIRVIVQVGREKFSGGDQIDTAYRVFEIDNPLFEALLKGDDKVHLIGMEVFDKPPSLPAPPLPAGLPAAVPVGAIVTIGPKSQAELLQELKAKHKANGRSHWWNPWSASWGKTLPKPLPLP